MFGLWKAKPKPKTEGAFAVATHVVDAYAEVLETNSGLIAEKLSALPFEKKLIEKSIVFMFSQPISNEYREALEVSYMALSQYQEMTEHESLAVSIVSSAMKSASNTDALVMENMADTLAAYGHFVIAVQKRISDEMSLRRSELDKMAGAV